MAVSQSIPALCVQSSDILSGAPAAEAAMPNVRMLPLNWWSEQKVQVHIQLIDFQTLFLLIDLGPGPYVCQTQVCSTACG